MGLPIESRDRHPGFSMRFVYDGITPSGILKFLSCVAHGVKVWHKRMWYNGRERKVSFVKMNLKSGFLLMYDW